MVVFACASVVPAAEAQAQEYPSHAIQFVVPSTPGTTGDQLARLLGVRLSQRWGVPVIVDNKVGAGGSLGMETVAKATPDGYTVLLSATSFSTLPALRVKLNYDPLKSFAPVVLLGTSPLVLIVANDVPAQSVREFIDYARKQPPGKLNYASPGVGSVQHLTMEMFKQQTGLHLTHIPYKGTSGAVNDLAAGHVDTGVVTFQTALPMVQAGRMRMIAVLGGERVTQFPKVPTLAQAGVPKVVSEAWFGVTAPAGTPPAVVAKMNNEINSLLALPEVREAMDKAGINPIGGTPAKLEALVRSQIRMWSQVVATGNISAE